MTSVLIANLFGDMLFRLAVLKPDVVCLVFQLVEFVIDSRFKGNLFYL